MNIEMTNYCRKCGEEIRHKDLWCNKCRKEVDEEMRGEIRRPRTYYLNFYLKYYYKWQHKERWRKD